ncbi:MAG: hypothetical protein JO102_02710, partial [Elusimicrobia bacterium]|nr:hypothetical protein [Elusimicrobiota bacterium]
FGGADAHAGVLARLFEFAAKRQLTGAQFASILSQLKGDSAGRQAAEIVRAVLEAKGDTATLEDGHKMAEEILKIAKGDAGVLSGMMTEVVNSAARGGRNAPETFAEDLVDRVLNDRGLSPVERKKLIELLSRTDLAVFLTSDRKLDPNVRDARNALGLSEGETAIELTQDVVDSALFAHIATLAVGQLDDLLKEKLGLIRKGEQAQARKTELERRVEDLEKRSKTDPSLRDELQSAKEELKQATREAERSSPETASALKVAAIAMQARYGGNAGQAFAVAATYTDSHFLERLTKEYRNIVRVEGDRILLRVDGAEVKAEIRDANKGLLPQGQAVDLLVTDAEDRSGILLVGVEGARVLKSLRDRYGSAEPTPASRALDAAEQTGVFGDPKLTVVLRTNGVEVVSGRGRSETSVFVGKDGSFGVRTSSRALVTALAAAGHISTDDADFILAQMGRGGLFRTSSSVELAFRFRATERTNDAGEKVKVVRGRLEAAEFEHGGATLAQYRQTERAKRLGEASQRDGSAKFEPGDDANTAARKLAQATNLGFTDTTEEAIGALKSEEARRSDEEDWASNPQSESRFEDQLFNALSGRFGSMSARGQRRLIGALENSGSEVQARVARRLTLELFFNVSGLTRSDRAALIAEIFGKAFDSVFSFMRDVPDPALAENFGFERLLASAEGRRLSPEFLGDLREARANLEKEGKTREANLLGRLIDRLSSGEKADLSGENAFHAAWREYHGQVADRLRAGRSMQEIAAEHG